MTIKKVSNGYIITNYGKQIVYNTLEDVFQYLKETFEGKSKVAEQGQ